MVFNFKVESSSGDHSQEEVVLSKEKKEEGHPRWSCAPGTRALRRASFDGRT